MSKASIFTTFLSAIMIIVLAEVLAHDYFSSPGTAEDVSANVAEADQQQESALPAPESEIEITPVIDFELFTEAGSTGLTLQRIPFSGILFKAIDLRDFNSIPIVNQNVLHQNKQKVAVFSELHGGSSAVADEIYSLILEKGDSLLEASANETNDFGDGSFYLNFTDKPNDAFLVVKKGGNVYALTYEKSFHPFVTTIVQLLP
jgi:hypothetical protein